MMTKVRIELAAAAIALASPASADFTVCNDSFDVLNIALAYGQGAEFVSQGWWSVAPNRCVALLRGDIPVRYLYLFATDVFNRAVLDGEALFCTDTGRFRIIGVADCRARGHLVSAFSEVDIGSASEWVVILGDD